MDRKGEFRRNVSNSSRRQSNAEPGIPKTSTDNSKRKSSNSRRRSSSVAGSLKQNLMAIKTKRLSADAPLKGLFPQRTPSLTAMSPESKPGEMNKGVPILSLTKLDFELLREWDWKQRHKRLETWTEGLGIGKGHRMSEGTLPTIGGKIGPSSFSEAVKARSEKIAQAKSTARKGLILKRELENLTGKRVHPPEVDEAAIRIQQADPVGKVGRKSIAAQGTSYRKGSKRRSGHRNSYMARHQEQLEKVDKELEKVIDKARALELKSTFGKGWGRQITSQPRKSSATTNDGSPPGEGIHRHRHHRHRHHRKHHERTSAEEEQPPTSYASVTSRGQTTTTGDDASPIPSPSGSADSFGLPGLFKSIHELENVEEVPEDDSSEEAKEEQKTKEEQRFSRGPPPVEFQDTCFGGIKFVDRQALKPVTKDKKGREFYMTFADTDLGLGLGKAQHLRIRFFKPDGPGTGRSDRILAREVSEKARREKEEKERLLKEQEAQRRRTTIKTFTELPEVLDLTEEDKLKYAEKLAELDKALARIPGIGSAYRMSVEAVSRKPSTDIPAGGAGAASGRVSRRQQFTRPPRRVWYTPLPMAIKKYFRTNWRKIKFDVRNEMRKRNFWPKLWINFEETHPKQLFELIHYKLAVKQFDEEGFKRIFNWGRGVHPDYVDWILEDIVPHPGKYYYDNAGRDPVRKASLDEDDFNMRNWFTKPPRYVPPTPPSPPFDQFDFCGYGNRENSYFLDFTLPREIMHYYSPPSNIELFFQEIPKPPYAFPGYTFKRWLKYPLDQKLPQYYPFPKRFSIWTRGKLGDTINCNSTSFKLDDPLLKKRDPTYNPYHDIHTRKYFLKKSVLDRIWELGIINSKGEVKCTMKEFNEHRRYLRDYEWLEECLRRWTDKWLSRLEHNRLTKDTNIELLDWESKKQIYRRKLESCKRNRKLRDEMQEKRNRRMQEKYEKQLSHAAEKKNQLQLEMMLRARRMKKEQRVRNRNLQNLMQGRALFLQQIYALRHKRALRHRKRYHMQTIVTKLERQKDTWLRHVEFNKKKMEEMKEIQAKLEEEHMGRIDNRKQMMKKVWRDIPLAIIRKQERQRQEDERTKYLAFKYFHIWLNRTQQIKKARDAGFYDSAWNIRHMLDSYVQRLKGVSGHMKVEDHIFAMIQNKLEEEKRKRSQELRKQEEEELRKLRGGIHFKVEQNIGNYLGSVDYDDDRTGLGQHYKVDDSDSEDVVNIHKQMAQELLDTGGYDADLDDD